MGNISDKTLNNPLLEAQYIKEAVAKQTKDILRSVVAEEQRKNLGNIIKESPDDEFEEEEIVDDTNVDDTHPDENAEDIEINDVEDEEDLDDGANDYVVNNNSLDLTGADDVDAIEVFKKLKDDTQVVVVKTDSGVKVSDNETGAEYIINLDDDDADVDIEENEEISESGNTDWKFTTTQTKTAMDSKGLGNNCPNKNKSLDKVPTGTEKRFGKGPGKGVPFTENEDIDDVPLTEDDVVPIDENEQEITEAGVTRTKANLRQRTGKKTQPQIKYTAGIRVDKVRDGAILKSEDASERVAKLEKMYETIKEDNQILKEGVKQFKEAACKYYEVARETALTNYKLGRAVKLFAEHSTTQEEKTNIVERLQDAKNSKEVDTIYESLKKELKTKKPIVESIDHGFKTEINVEKQSHPVYMSEQLQRSLEIMNKING
jgi:hypothetical protein